MNKNPPFPPKMAAPDPAVLNTVRPPTACPEPLRDHVDLITEKLRKLLTEYEIPWKIQAKLGEEGYVWISDLAVRYEDRRQALTKSPEDFEFKPDDPGYSEAKTKLVAGRIASLVMAAQALTKEKVGEALSIKPEGDDYMAMLDQGDREAMIRAHASRCHGHRIDPDEQGSDHFLALLKRSFSRGEVPIVQLKQIVPFMPEPGEINFQKRHHKEKTGESYVEEAIKEPFELDRWKRTMTIWRNSLLMAVAVCQSQPSVDLTKATLDELYDEYLYGREIMKKSKPPSLAIMKVAERKFWREVSLRLMKAKGKGKSDTMESVVLEVRKDTLFWQREVYDWCSSQGSKTKPDKSKKRNYATNLGRGKWQVQKNFLKNAPKFKQSQPKGQSKGKQKGKGKKGKGMVCFVCGKVGHTAMQCRQNPLNQQQQQQGAQIPPPQGAPSQPTRTWAPRGVDGKPPCREYHGGANCRFGASCRFSHLCPVLKRDGSICGQTHRATDHP